MRRVVIVPKAALFPVVLALCTIGAYALSNTTSNVYVLRVFDVLGYGMVKPDFPPAPLIIGVVHGDQIEINPIQALMTDSNPWEFVTLPISAGAARGGRRVGAVFSVAAPQARFRHSRVGRND
jgi:putative tricarboxylic transport membrane protein